MRCCFLDLMPMWLFLLMSQRQNLVTYCYFLFHHEFLSHVSLQILFCFFIILYCTIYHFSFSSLCYPIPIAPVSSHAPCVCLLQSHLFPPLPPFPTLGITNLFGLYTLSYREKELEFSLKINILRIFGTFVCTDHLFPMLLNNILDIDDNLFKYSLIGRLVSSFHFLLWWLELPWIFT